MINDPAKTAGGTLGEYAYRDGRGDRSIGDVLKDIFGNVQEMIRAEIRLARAEMREEAGKTLSSAQMMAIGQPIVPRRYVRRIARRARTRRTNRVVRIG